MIAADPIQEARRLVTAAQAQGLALRIVGGTAIAIHSEHIPSALRRSYQDIDLICDSRSGGGVLDGMLAAGYLPNERFNSLHGHRRLVVYDDEHARHVDVFVGHFEMCHQLPIAARLGLDSPTVSVADLLLTKLQIHALNRKDEGDILTVLLNHELADHDDDAINAGYIGSLLAADWGLWRTCHGTLVQVKDHLTTHLLAPDEHRVITSRLDALVATIQSAPKSLRWKARGRIGERARWYEEPDDIDHAPAGVTG